MDLNNLLSVVNGNNGTDQYELASVLYNGGKVDITASKEGAFNLFFSAAKNGNPEAKYVVANAYFNGEHVEKSSQQALEWLNDSVNAGSPVGKLSLAEILFTGSNGEFKFEVNHGKAFELYSELSDKIDHPTAQYRLGYMYHNGVFVEKNIDKAAEYYSKVVNNAAKDIPTNVRFVALKDLGYIYQKGTSAIDANPKKAIDYHLKALSLLSARDYNAYPHANVMEFEVGSRLILGEGVEQNEKEGFDLVYKAATHGNAQAAIAVALAYEQGLYGLDKDIVEALAILSSLTNNEAAKRLLSELRESINNQEPADHGDYTFEKALGFVTVPAATEEIVAEEAPKDAADKTEEVAPAVVDTVDNTDAEVEAPVVENAEVTEEESAPVSTEEMVAEEAASEVESPEDGADKTEEVIPAVVVVDTVDNSDAEVEASVVDNAEVTEEDSAPVSTEEMVAEEAASEVETPEDGADKSEEVAPEVDAAPMGDMLTNTTISDLDA